MAKDEWVRVKDESELRAGMTVELRPCMFCHRKERQLILSELGTRTIRDHNGNRYLGRGFVVTGSCNPEGLLADSAAFYRPVRDGRLYRLADSQLADLSESRELETVR